MSKAIVAGEREQSKNIFEELQSSFIRRFSSTPLADEPIVYEFTNDRALLHQYYRLREIMYRKVFHTDKFVGEEDIYDKLSYILIARRGKLCVGGCRLTIREADEDYLLPMESKSFKLRDVFPNLPLRKLRHGEISRFAIIDDEDDSLEIMLALSQLIIGKCIGAGLGFAFLKSSLPMARNWRRIGQTQCGLKKMRICTEVKVPENPIHPDITWYLTEIPLPAAESALYEEHDAHTRPAGSLVH